MKRGLIDILCCPHDASGLTLTVLEEDESEVESGTLLCQVCGAEYPIVRSVPRFVGDDYYVKSFSLEWKTHSKTQMPDSRDHETFTSFHQRSGFTAEELRGQLMLDAGCGVGRYLAVAEEYGAEVVGVDLSYSVDQAMANVGRLPRVNVVQADLMRLPFRSDTFDRVFSLGVLHHMPEPRNGFESLVPLVKPGGTIAVSVYPSSASFYTASQRLRRITTRLNKRLLYAITTAMAMLLYPLYRLPVLKAFYSYAPISMHPKPAWRRLDTFDCYSPRYQHTYTYHEVFRWFKDHGLTDIDVLEVPVSVKGSRPIPPGSRSHL